MPLLHCAKKLSARRIDLNAVFKKCSQRGENKRIIDLYTKTVDNFVNKPRGRSVSCDAEKVFSACEQFLTKPVFAL
jgi:hypothetical protein